MAKNKNRQQPAQQNRGREAATERSAEQQAQSAVSSEAPTPSNLAERSKKAGKKFGHN